MKFKKQTKESKKPISSTVLFITAIVVLLIAVASIVNTAMIYNKTVSQYVEQGYESAEVVSQLLPNQLLPAIFETIAIYGGIAFLLFGVGIINNKLSQHLKSLPRESATQFVDTNDSIVSLSDAPKETDVDLSFPVESED